MVERERENCDTPNPKGDINQEVLFGLSIFRGGPYSVPAFVNRLTEAFALEPPQLIHFVKRFFNRLSINRDG